MRLLEKVLLKGCGYSILMLAAFYAFGMPHTVFAHFLIITLFGMIISVSDLIFKAKKMHIALKTLIHFLVLFSAFYIIFIVIGNQIKTSSGNIFVAVVIFTVFYAVMTGIVYILRKSVEKIDDKIGSKYTNKSPKTEQKNEYKALYK